MHSKELKEFNIPVPWGHIAVKTIGNDKRVPIVLAHGIGDNMAAFDPLLRHLPENYYYICIDLPSHGKSSNFPPAVPTMHMINFVFAFKMIFDYFAREKYILIAHSWSGHLLLFYTQMYPEQIQKLVILDVIYSYPITVEFFKQYFRERFSKIMDRTKIVEPAYTYKEIYNRMFNSRVRFERETDPDAFNSILARSLIPVGEDQYKVSIDKRLRCYLPFLYDMQFAIALIKEYPITCPILYIISKDSFPSTIYFKQVLKELKKRNNKCFVEYVDGSHSVYVNQPEETGSLINSFLTESSSKL